MESGIIHIQEKDQEEIVLNFFSNITLNKPRNGYYLFINDMFAKEISKNKKFLMKEAHHKYAPIWKSMTEEEKKPYEDKAKEERKKYQNDIELVEKYLIKEKKKQKTSGYHYFYNEKIKEIKENNKDKKIPIEELKNVYSTWNKMTPEEKSVWNKKNEIMGKEIEKPKIESKRKSPIKQDNSIDEDDLSFSKNNVSCYVSPNEGRATGFSVFVQKNMFSEDNMEIGLSFDNYKFQWEKLPENIRKKYEKEAKCINDILFCNKNVDKRNLHIKIKNEDLLDDEKDNKEFHQDSELTEDNDIVLQKKRKCSKDKTSSIVPKRPGTAYSLFLKDLAKETDLAKASLKENKQRFYSKASKLWTLLSPEQKEKYEKMAHIKRLIYTYKKQIFKKTRGVNKTKRRGVSGYNLFMGLYKNDKSIPKNINYVSYVKEKWSMLTEEEKEKFRQKANQLNEEKSKQINSKKIYAYPKRPKTGYQIFLGNKTKELKNIANGDMPKIMTAIGKMWADLSEEQKQKYIDEQERRHKVYLKQKSQYEEKGYYLVDENENNCLDGKEDVIVKIELND